MDNLDKITQTYRNALNRENYDNYISYSRAVELLVQIAHTLRVNLNELTTDEMLKCVQIEQTNRIEA